MRRRAIRIAGLTIELATDDPALPLRFDDPVSRFEVEPTRADLALTVRIVETLAEAEGELLFDSGAVWTLVRQDAALVIECRSAESGHLPYKTAVLDPSMTRGELLINGSFEQSGNPLEYPLDEVLVSQLLGRGRGVELHGCGLIDDGDGYLFVGQSGAGKTTTARLWQPHGVEIVSDDRVIVREQDGSLRMWGSPWHGEAELASTAAAPLAGVFLLQQATDTAVIELSRAEAAARLFTCAFPLFHDGEALAFTIDFLGRLAATVPVRELRFTRDQSAVEAVRATAREMVR